MSTTLALQHCTTCGTVQYPPRELCVACLADTLTWRVTEGAAGEVLAETLLHHSHEAAFDAMLPIRVGLVRLDAGPTAVCFLEQGCAVGGRVTLDAKPDGDGRTVLSAAALLPSLRAPP